MRGSGSTRASQLHSTNFHLSNEADKTIKPSPRTLRSRQ